MSEMKKQHTLPMYSILVQTEFDTLFVYLVIDLFYDLFALISHYKSHFIFTLFAQNAPENIKTYDFIG